MKLPLVKAICPECGHRMSAVSADALWAALRDHTAWKRVRV